MEKYIGMFVKKHILMLVMNLMVLLRRKEKMQKMNLIEG